MDENFRRWMSQITTGHGAMILGPTLLAVASGTLSWGAATPFLVAGVAGLLWPERHISVRPDVAAIVAAYQAGLDHGTRLSADMESASHTEDQKAPANRPQPDR